jgi:hypothetical protein
MSPVPQPIARLNDNLDTAGQSDLLRHLIDHQEEKGYYYLEGFH